jgi:hypothetical protein
MENMMAVYSEKEIAQEFLQDPKFKELVETAAKATDNQTKMADAVVIAAQAFARLVTIIEKTAEKEYGKGE